MVGFKGTHGEVKAEGTTERGAHARIRINGWDAFAFPG